MYTFILNKYGPQSIILENNRKQLRYYFHTGVATPPPSNMKMFNTSVIEQLWILIVDCNSRNLSLLSTEDTTNYVRTKTTLVILLDWKSFFNIFLGFNKIVWCDLGTTMKIIITRWSNSAPVKHTYRSMCIWGFIPLQCCMHSIRPLI